MPSINSANVGGTVYKLEDSRIVYTGYLSVSVPKSSYNDFDVSFPAPVDSATYKVLLTESLSFSGTASAVGVKAVLKGGSRTVNGFSVRVYNNLDTQADYGIAIAVFA